MNESPAAPEMSVLLVTPDDFTTIRKTVRHLRAQTVCDRLELVIITPSRARLRLNVDEVAGFGAVRVVEVCSVCPASAAKATALVELTTPYVAFAEDHCYPEPNWAEALLAAQQAGHSIVGPVIENANPASAVSWANFIASFGRWIGPLTTGASDHSPYHNTSYRRDLLLGFGPALPGLLAIEHFLQEDLRAAGHQPHLTAATRAHHVNFSRARPWLLQTFLGGRLFAGTRWRWERWPAWKRVIYFAGSPLIPFLRLYRTIPAMRRDPRQWRRWPLVLPALLLGLIVHALGEMTGYLCGLGDTEPRYSRLELRRLDHVTAHDRAQLSDE